MVSGHVRQESGEDGRGDAHGGRERVRGTDAPSRDDHGSDKWSDEQPDPKGATKGRQGAGAELYREGPGEVRVPGKTEDRIGQPSDRDGHCKQDHGLGQEGTQQRHGVKNAGRNQSALFPDSGSQRACRKIADQLPDTNQRDDERCRPHAGAECSCGERHKREDRALTDGHQNGRPVHRNDDPAQADELWVPFVEPGRQSVAARDVAHSSEHLGPWTPIRLASEWWSSPWTGYASNFRPMSSSWPLNVHVIAEFPTGADTLDTEPGQLHRFVGLCHLGFRCVPTTLAR